MRQKHVISGTNLIDLVMLHISLSNFVWWFLSLFLLSKPIPPTKEAEKKNWKPSKKIPPPPLLRGKTRVGSSSRRDSNSSSPSAHFPEISRKSGFFFFSLLPFPSSTHSLKPKEGREIFLGSPCYPEVLILPMFILFFKVQSPAHIHNLSFVSNRAL